MALSLSYLTDQIRKVIDPGYAGFVGYPATTADAAANWATAYDKYASAAQDVSGDAISISNKPGFQSTLTFSWPSPDVGSVAAATNAFDLAFISYWAGAIFETTFLPTGGIGGTGIFSVETTSTVSSVTAGVLSGYLTTEFANVDVDISAKATGLANAFHTATLEAVTVLITGLDTTPSPTGPLPIINTGGVV